MISQSILSRAESLALNIAAFLQQVGSLSITVSETVKDRWREITLTADSELRRCFVSLHKLKLKSSQL